MSQWPKWLRRQYGKLEICGSSPGYDTNFSLKNCHLYVHLIYKFSILMSNNTFAIVDHRCGLGATLSPLTQRARVRSPVSFPGWGFFRDFSSTVRQMSGKPRPQPSTDVISHRNHHQSFITDANELTCRRALNHKITINIIIIVIIIRVFCPRAGSSLQTQELIPQFCWKAGLPSQAQEPRLQFCQGFIGAIASHYFPHPTFSLASAYTLKDLIRSQGHQRGDEESGFG